MFFLKNMKFYGSIYKYTIQYQKTNFLIFFLIFINMKLLINDNLFKCKVCNTPESITKGMMKRKFDGFDCMVFLMPEKKEQQFWMYDCLIPLDIVMVNDNVIETINPNCLPCVDSTNCEYYEGFGNVVLEFEGGTCDMLGIKVGDKIKMSVN
jgi:uncharacterized membrane protein (UPF0127 family)